MITLIPHNLDMTADGLILITMHMFKVVDGNSRI